MKRSPLKRKTPLKKQSAKMKEKTKIYTKLRKEFLSENGICKVCLSNPSEHVHHIERRGKNHNEVSTFMAVCSLCHTAIHDNVSWAKEKGYLI